MSTKYYIDSAGNYLGGFQGAEPPVGAIEVPIAPKHAAEKWDGLNWSLPLAASREVVWRKIDADVDDIIGVVIGNRYSEYTTAKEQAASYVAAGYTGAVPPYVQAWADAKKQTARWAADSIIATASSWGAAQESIRVNRLALKEAARNAVDQAALDGVKAQWSTFLAAIKAQLGIA